MSDITKAGTQFTPTWYQDSSNTVSPTTRVNPPSLAVLTPPTNARYSGLKAGEDIDWGDPCYIKASDGKVYRSKININAAPAAPTCSNTADGTGLWNGQVLLVQSTYVTAYGESDPSIPTLFKITTTGQLHIAAYTTLDDSITAVNTYINGILWVTTATTANATPAIDVSGATPTLNGYAPPSRNTAYKDGAYRIDGYAEMASKSGEAVTLVENVEVAYGTTNYPSSGAFVYLSANAGQIATAAASGATNQKPCGKAVAKPDPISTATAKHLVLWASRE